MVTAWGQGSTGSTRDSVTDSMGLMRSHTGWCGGCMDVGSSVGTEWEIARDTAEQAGTSWGQCVNRTWVGGQCGDDGVSVDTGGQWGTVWRQTSNLEECDGGAVAHAEQEERDEDGDGRPEPVQLPVLGLGTGLIQFQPWTERGGQCLSHQGGAGGDRVCQVGKLGGPGERAAGLGSRPAPWSALLSACSGQQPEFPNYSSLGLQLL